MYRGIFCWMCFLMATLSYLQTHYKFSFLLKVYVASIVKKKNSQKITSVLVC